MSRKLPTALHEAKGTDRADRQNDDEPRPELGMPALPAELSDEEVVEWHRCVDILRPLGVLTVADGLALQQLVTSIIECRDLKAAVRDASTVRVTTTQKETVDRVNPLYPQWNQARDRLMKLWAMFGLDPTARTSLHTVKPPPKQGVAPDDSKKQGRQGKAAASYFTH